MSDRWAEVNRNSEGVGVSLYEMDEDGNPILIDEWYAFASEIDEFDDEMRNVVLE